MIHINIAHTYKYAQKRATNQAWLLFLIFKLVALAGLAPPLAVSETAVPTSNTREQLNTLEVLIGFEPIPRFYEKRMLPLTPQNHKLEPCAGIEPAF